MQIPNGARWLAFKDSHGKFPDINLSLVVDFLRDDCQPTLLDRSFERSQIVDLSSSLEMTMVSGSCSCIIRVKSISSLGVPDAYDTSVHLDLKAGLTQVKSIIGFECSCLLGRASRKCMHLATLIWTLAKIPPGMKGVKTSVTPFKKPHESTAVKLSDALSTPRVPLNDLLHPGDRSRQKRKCQVEIVNERKQYLFSRLQCSETKRKKAFANYEALHAGSGDVFPSFDF